MHLWSELPFFPGCSGLSALDFGSQTDVQKFVAPKPFIVPRRANNRRKAEKLAYDFPV
jgi:hypothetical protein